MISPLIGNDDDFDVVVVVVAVSRSAAHKRHAPLELFPSLSHSQRPLTNEKPSSTASLSVNFRDFTSFCIDNFNINTHI